MKEDDTFLSRWSRRKQQAAQPDASQANRSLPQGSSETSPERKSAASPAIDRPAQPAAPLVDLSRLPSLDSIGPTTDIRPFLQPGVPGSLSHAALRRMWSADPAIRDYIGPSENAWDFTAADGMPGFGPLLPSDDVKRLLAQVFGEETPDGTAAGSDATAFVDPSSPPAPAAEPQQRDVKTAEDQLGLISEHDLPHRSESDVAAHKEQDIVSVEPNLARRRHGRALPT